MLAMKINPMIEMGYRLVCSGVSNGFERKKLVILVNAITRIVMLSICLGIIFNGFERLKLEIVVNANINNAVKTYPNSIAGLSDVIFMNAKINAKANKLIMLKTTYRLVILFLMENLRTTPAIIINMQGMI